MHEESWTSTAAVAQDVAREFFAVKPFLLEADCACVARPAFGVSDCWLRGKVRAESVRPFCGGCFVDELVGVGWVFGGEGFGCSEDVFGEAVVAWFGSLLVLWLSCWLGVEPWAAR